jgi:hypothetical protein
MTAHNQCLPTNRSIPYWTTSVFSSTVTGLVLIYNRSLLLRLPWTTTLLRKPNDDSLMNELSWIEMSNRVDSYVTTDGQSASASWNKAPIWGLRPNFYYCQTVEDLLIWGALSDERTGLSFTIAAGLCQHSHSWVRVPWDSRLYFTVSNSRLPYDSQGYGGGIRSRLHAGFCRINYVSSPYNSGRTELRPPPRTVRVLFRVYSLPRESVARSCITMDYSGFQASCHNIHE